MRIARPSRVIAALFTKNIQPSKLLDYCLNPAFTCSASATSILHHRAVHRPPQYPSQSAESFLIPRRDGTFGARFRHRIAVSRPIPARSCHQRDFVLN